MYRNHLFSKDKIIMKVEIMLVQYKHETNCERYDWHIEFYIRYLS